MNEEPFRTGEGEIDRDAAFRLLSHAYRRALIDCLDRRDEALPVADVAEDVAVRNDTRSNGEIPAEVIERVHLALHHSHVPKLADEDVVAYDRDRDAVALTDRGERLVAVHRRVSKTTLGGRPE